MGNGYRWFGEEVHVWGGVGWGGVGWGGVGWGGVGWGEVGWSGVGVGLVVGVFILTLWSPSSVHPRRSCCM